MAVKFKKAKSALYGVACATALMSGPASAQIPVIGSLPVLGSLSGGGLPGLDLLSGGGIPVIGSLSGGGIPVIGSLSGGGLPGLDLLSGGGIPVIGSLSGGGLPGLDLLSGGGIPVIGSLSGGGLPGLDLLSGGGIPLLSGGLPLNILSLESLSDNLLGAIPLVGGTGLGGLDGLDALSLDGIGSLASATDVLGLELPSLTTGLLTGGLDSFIDLGLDIVSNVLGGGGIAAIPLVGVDLSNTLTADGLTRSLEDLATSYILPVGLPVIGRNPLQLYGPVVFSALGAQGLDLGTGAVPTIGEILGGDVGGLSFLGM